MMIRRDRYSVAVSLAGAVSVFPVLLVVAAFLLRGILIGLVDSGFGFGGLSDNVILSIMTAICVVLAYIPSRMMFMALRWKTLEHDPGYCLKCNYNLTGNVSGICPECGSPVITDAPAE